MKIPYIPDYHPPGKLAEHLKDIDVRLVEWAQWLRSLSRHRNLPLKQIYGVGLLGTGRNKRLPLYVKRLDLAVAALCRSDPEGAQVIWAHYLTKAEAVEKAKSCFMDIRTYNERLKIARSALNTSLAMLRSPDLIERSVGLRTREKNGQHAS